MRNVAWVLLSPLLLIALNGQAGAQITAVPTLTDRVRSLAEQHHGTVALFAENLKTH